MRAAHEMRRLMRLLASVKIQHPIFGVMFAEWMPVSDDALELVIWAQVPDRDQPSAIDRRPVPTTSVRSEISLSIHQVLKLCDHDAQTYLAGELREALIGGAMHEVDEMIMIGGVRVNDPHAGEDLVRKTAMRAHASIDSETIKQITQRLAHEERRRKP